ncbi:MAG: hypothetical protein H7A33_07035 [Deltaproteobacteria bacterium]|nr:hypothetical protein [Deltaproteobacteria bacterium]
MHDFLKNKEFIHQGKTFVIKEAQDTDLDQIVESLNQTYSIWKHLGIQGFNRDKVKSYMNEDGMLVWSQSDKKFCGALCLRDAQIELIGNIIHVHRATRIDKAKINDPDFYYKKIQNRKIVYGYSLAIFPEFSKTGVGLSFIDFCWQIFKSKGYEGGLLETAKESDWLIEWYKKLGFKIIAESSEPRLGVTTVMMMIEL